MHKSYFSQCDEDTYRLPEGIKRIDYDADTQCYTFRDRSGQLYQNAPGEEYGVLRPLSAPFSHRRHVTITEIHDPALREWSRYQKSAKTFDDILPPAYITAANSAVESPTSILSPREKLFQAAMPKVRGVVEIVRRRATLPRLFGSRVSRNTPPVDERRKLLGDDTWEIV